MCFTKAGRQRIRQRWQRIAETAEREGLSWKSSLLTLAALIAGIVLIASCIVRNLSFRPPATVTATQSSHDLAAVDARHALQWLKKKMPNTTFRSAEVDPDAPWLVRVRTASGKVPVDYDPAHHTLLIGLVINFDRPFQDIAPGRLVGGESQ